MYLVVQDSRGTWIEMNQFITHIIKGVITAKQCISNLVTSSHFQHKINIKLLEGK